MTCDRTAIERTADVGYLFVARLFDSEKFLVLPKKPTPQVLRELGKGHFTSGKEIGKASRYNLPSYH